MARSHSSQGKRFVAIYKSIKSLSILIMCLLVLTSRGTAQNQQPIAGRNVNMVSGTQWPGGDPFLQRQNEPSLAVSTRNPQHILAGANDYRTVDIPFDIPVNLDPDGEKTSDAWLGLFKSRDGGNSWTSALIPGYPQDPAGKASPLYGYQAASDPVVRAGTNGLFFYSGIVFNRPPSTDSAIFVSRFIDNNNTESGDSISYIDTTVLSKQKKKWFLDKPWIAVDIPRKDAKKCKIPQTTVGGATVASQTFPAGVVYVAYSAFDTNDYSKIDLLRSDDCGSSWNGEITLSAPNTQNQGATIAIDPNTGYVYVAWRQFVPTNAILISQSTDGGKHFSAPMNVAGSAFVPFDQEILVDGNPANTPSPTVRRFRTASYPAVAVDMNPAPGRPGRVYVALAQMVSIPGQALPQSRIVMYTSADGLSWTSQPQVVDPVSTDSNNNQYYVTGHQLMPALTFANGKLMLAYYDSRNNQMGLGTVPLTATAGGITDTNGDATSGNPAKGWSNIDVRIAEANPGAAPVFYSAQVSRYRWGVDPKTNQVTQLEYNYPNLPLFAQGTAPFIGDYIDIAPSPAFVVKNGDWVYNTDASNSAVYHTAWTDNRDVVPPPPPAYDWTKYLPPGSPAIRQTSLFDGQTPVAVCSPSNPGTAGMRNQNIYTSDITQGLVVTAPGNSKPLGNIQRGFVIVVKNTAGAVVKDSTTGDDVTLTQTQTAKTFLLHIVPPPAGVQASFLQFQAQPDVWVQIPAKSSAARTVYASSTNPEASVTVQVTEVAGVGLYTAVQGGLSGSVMINADSSNPTITDPSLVSAENYTGIISNTVTVDANVNPNILNPNILNPNILNPNILNPNILNTDVLNPNILNPNILNPNILNPNILNPDILNPNILNPNILNANLSDTQITDLTWDITNTGNTTAAYNFKNILNKNPNGFAFELLVYRVSNTPALNPNSSCQLDNQGQPHQELAVNITNPNILNPDILNPNILNSSISDATFALAPGETGKAVLRVIHLNKNDGQTISGIPTDGSTTTAVPVSGIKIADTTMNAAVTAMAVNTTDVQAGITQPPVTTSTLAIVSPRTLPVATAGRAYNYQLQSSGSQGFVSWSTPNGIPAGIASVVSVSSSGLISGTPNQPGTYPIYISATDSVSTVSDTFTLIVDVAGQANLVFAAQPEPCIGTPVAGCARVGEPLPAVLVKALDGSGSPVPGVSVQISIGSASVATTGSTLSGTTTQTTDSTGTASFSDLTLSLPATYQLKAVASGSSIVLNSALTAPFNVLPLLGITTSAMPDGVAGKPYLAALSAIGGIPPYSWTEVNADGSPLPAGTSHLPPGLFLNAPGTPVGSISGNPNLPPQSPTSYQFTVEVADSVLPQATAIRTLTIRVSDPMTVSPLAGTRLPDGSAGTAYAYSFPVSGGIPNYSCIANSIPAGFTLSYNSSAGACVLSGTPSSAADYSVTFAVNDSSSPMQTVAAGPYPLHITGLQITAPAGASLPGGTVASPYSYTLMESNGAPPVNWTIVSGSLPQGLTLSPSAPNPGLISGTPAVGSAGTSTFTVQVADANGQIAAKQLSMFVAFTTNVPSSQTYSVGNLQYPVIAQGGTAPYNWTLAAGALPPGVLLSTRVPPGFAAIPATTGLIGVTAATGTYNFTLAVTDARNVTVLAPSSITISPLIETDLTDLPDAFVANPYTYTLASINNSGPVNWSLVNGALPPGLNLVGNQITGTPTAAGSINFILSATDANGTIYKVHSLNISALKLNGSPMLPNATVNSPYSTTLTASGGNGTYRWTTPGGLPPGLTLAPGGVISGTPPAGPGTYKFIITISDTGGNSYVQNFALNVIGQPAVLPSFTEFINDLTVGTPLSNSIGVTGGTAPYTWSASGLPAGLSLRTGAATRPYVPPSDAEIAGAVAATGDYPVTFSVTDSSSPAVTISRQYTLHVSPLNNDSPANGTLGAPYSFNLRPFGGAAPWLAVLNSGAWPAGLNMDSSGLITGTPAESGQFCPVITMSDSSSGTLRRTLCLFVNSAGSGTVSINNYYLLPDANQGQPYFFTMSAGGANSFTWSVDAGSSLPPGLSLSSGGVLSGTPSVSGTTSFLIRATDSSNPANYAAKQFTLTVTPLQITFNTVVPPATIGVPYSTTLTVSGGSGPYTWTVAPGTPALPAGLSISGNTITGTPAANSGGQYYLTLIVTDSAMPANTRHVNINLAVVAPNAAPEIQTGPNLGTWATGDVQVELRAGGGGGPTVWTLTQGSLPPGLAIRTDMPSWFSAEATAGLIGVATTTGSYTFTLQAASAGGAGAASTQTFNLKVTALEARDYWTLPNAFAGAPYSYTFSSTSAGTVHWRVQPGTTLPAGLSLSDSGVLSGAPAAAGKYTISLMLSDGTDTVFRQSSLLISPIQITSGNLPNAIQGQSYSFQLTASPASPNYVWTAQGLQAPVLSLTTSGHLSAASVPAAPGNYNIMVTVTDTATGQSYTAPFTVNVIGTTPILPRITNHNDTSDFTIGMPVSYEFFADGGTAPYTWSAQGLPPGLELHFGNNLTPYVRPFDAEVWGVPTQLSAGTSGSSVTITATDSAGMSVSQTFMMRVLGLDNDFPPNPSGTRGSPLSFNMRALGGSSTTYSWASAASLSSKLPAGVSLNTSTGLISGTPLEDGFFNNRFGITNGVTTLNRYVGFSIATGTPASIDTYFSLPHAIVNQSYFYQLLGSGGSLTWSVLTAAPYSSNLPAGLSLSSNGVLSGTPTAATTGAVRFFAKAADINNPNNYSIRQFQMAVNSVYVTSNPVLPNGMLNAPYSTTLTATGGTGGPFTWTLTGNTLLPPGLTLDPTGVVSGTPISTGRYVFNTTVGAGSSFAIETFTLSIYPPVNGFLLTGQMTSPRVEQTATALPNGQILIAGGFNNNAATTLQTAELYDPSTGQSVATSGMTTARREHAAVLLPNGQVLIAGGIDGNGNILASTEIYDPATGTFSPAGNMVSARAYHTATALFNGKVLIAGGYSSPATPTNSVELFDPGTGSFAPVTSMSAARAKHAATVIDTGDVLITGGETPGGTASNSSDYYQVGGPSFVTWFAGPNMTQPRVNHRAVPLADGRVLVTGGNDGTSDLQSAEIYDQSSDMFSSTANMAAQRSSHAMLRLPNGKILIAGGQNSSAGQLASAELYDPDAGTFSATATNMSYPRAELSATILSNGNVLISGGSTATLELFQPAPPVFSSGTFTRFGFLDVARDYQTASRLSSDRILVIGGENFNGYLPAGAELYDSATGVVRPAGFLNVARAGHATTALANSKLLISGGLDVNFNAIGSTEIYDPSTEKFTIAAGMSNPRFDHYSVLVNGGKVLLAGGASVYGDCSSFRQDAELYDPGSNTIAPAGSMNSVHYGGVAVLLNTGKVLIAGGTDCAGQLNTAELYDPGSNTFTPTTGLMQHAREGAAAVLLADGRVLIAGGVDTSGKVAPAEIYDPGTDTFTATGSLIQTRAFYERAALLNDGRVLVTGDDSSSTAQIYDPVAGTFSLSGTANFTRTNYSIVTLSNGRIVLAGGVGSTDDHAQFEVWAP